MYDTENRLFVVLDPIRIARGIEEAFLNYDAQVIRWSQREKTENLLLLAS